jgi:hypothetical protein
MSSRRAVSINRTTAEADEAANVLANTDAALKLIMIGDRGDRPPMNWSILRYVFGHEEEDHNANETSQARGDSREAASD